MSQVNSESNESSETAHVSSAEIKSELINQDLPMINISDLKDHVKLSVLEAFTDDSFLEKKIKSVIVPLLTPYKDALSTANAESKQLKSQNLKCLRKILLSELWQNISWT